MNYNDALQYLDLFNNIESKLHQVDQGEFSLDNLKEFLLLIDNPQDKLQCVHIAGSKGKGSTAVFTAEILRGAGYRAGLYTSPHLYHIRERIRILEKGDVADGEIFDGCISQDNFAKLVQELKSVLDGSAVSLTYFEFLTALAFLYFFRQKVDVVVLEAGLGGRLDATNVIKPLVCGITQIDFEHTKILGDTLEKISKEKAGIIKSGCLGIVCSAQEKVTENIVRQQCNEHGVEFFSVDECDLALSLRGDFQKKNAAVAIKMIELMESRGFHVAEEVISNSLKEIVWPLRMEEISQNPTILLDGAHTPGSCCALVKNFTEAYPDCKMVLVMGLGCDKDKIRIAESFDCVARKVILTASSHERADKNIANELGFIFSEKEIEVSWCASLKNAINEACASVEDDVIVITGSLYLAAEARKLILH